MSLKEYCQSYEDYFWQWEDEAEVLTIPGGSTIAYRQFIVEILNTLTVQGLPLFGSLLLAVIATNTNGDNEIKKALAIIKPRSRNTDNVAAAFLQLLTQLPDKYKTGKKRIQVFQAIFQDCHKILSIKRSQKICDAFAGSPNSIRMLMQKEKFSSTVLESDLRVIDLLYRKFPSVQSIIDKIASLPEINTELDINNASSTNDATIDFVDELINNSKTFHVGALIRHLWSGLNIPFHNYLPSLQPLGGVSDLSNKGDFDKLLISEFANDDLVFLSRLANNEALYINREVPPDNNETHRIILLDVSLRNWGTPKTISIALALAIAKHPKTDMGCQFFCTGQNYESVSIETIDEVINSLQILDGSPHAAEGLSLFFKENNQLKNTEIFFISSYDATRSAAIQQVLHEHQSSFTYWINTDATGNISLFKKQGNSRKHIQDIQLPITELWKKQVKPKPVREGKTNFDSSWPILFSCSPHIKKLLCADDGEIFQVTGEKTLMRFYDKDKKMTEKGWEMICDIPSSVSDFEIGLLTTGEYVLLMYRPQTKEILLLNLNKKTTTRIDFKKYRHKEKDLFCFHEGSFYRFTNTENLEIRLDGRIIRSNKPRSELVDIFDSRERMLKEIDPYGYGRPTIMRNIKRVFINQVDNLVLNSHELLPDNLGNPKISKTDFLKMDIQARYENRNLFRFSDGSMVEIDRAGLLKLSSSNDQIPIIYVPLVLDVPLGMATKEYFAGNLYYHKEQLYNVVLKDSGPNPVSVIKHLNSFNYASISVAQLLVSKKNSVVLRNANISQTRSLVRSLEILGAIVEVEIIGSHEKKRQETINAKEFFDKYITNFIAHIRKSCN